MCSLSWLLRRGSAWLLFTPMLFFPQFACVLLCSLSGAVPELPPCHSVMTANERQTPASPSAQQWKPCLFRTELTTQRSPESFLLSFLFHSSLSLFFFGHPHGLWKFSGQGSNLLHSSDPSCCRDNTGSLTYCATGELTFSSWSVTFPWFAFWPVPSVSSHQLFPSSNCFNLNSGLSHCHVWIKITDLWSLSETCL